MKAGADPGVIKSFVQNWTGRFSVNADQILHLHSVGVSTDILTTLIHRSADLQAQPLPAGVSSAQATAPAPGQAPAYPEMAAPATPRWVYPYTTTYPLYTYSYVYPSYRYPLWSDYPFSFYYSWPSYRYYSWGHPGYYSHYGYRLRSGGYYGHGVLWAQGGITADPMGTADLLTDTGPIRLEAGQAVVAGHMVAARPSIAAGRQSAAFGFRPTA